MFYIIKMNLNFSLKLIHNEQPAEVTPIFLPTQVRRSGAKFSSGSGQEHVKLPSVLVHL